VRQNIVLCSREGTELTSQSMPLPLLRGDPLRGTSEMQGPS
jgi:hypothetical protein